MKRSWAIIVTACLAGGCGGGDGDKWTADRPKTVPAQGVLTHKGQPVEGATIVLAVDAAAATDPTFYGASAVTGSDGSFSLSAFPPDEGAVPGKYLVSVTKTESVQAPAPAEGSHDETPPPPPKQLLPQKYGDPMKSGVKLEIPADGKTDLKIELP